MANPEPEAFKKDVLKAIEVQSTKNLPVLQTPNVKARTDKLVAIINKDHLPPLKKLEHIYKYFDEDSEFFKPYISCSKGCDHCCHYDVQITELEAKYITKKTGIKHKNINEKIKNFAPQPCVFLSEKGECSIYEARPIACRAFMALGPSNLCEGGDKWQVQLGNAEFATPKSSLVMAYQMINHITGLTEELKLLDIRQFFKKRGVNGK